MMTYSQCSSLFNWYYKYTTSGVIECCNYDNSIFRW